ncbi:exosome component 10 isoform X2 [Aricia agestis]|uniref:exosome component 10 isoform X2 n=1 Tax=Aricia agestis TaxID=91739 RepID=UPI001C208B35|nr:exosome component 10 isoform X2 [Aricia agestis]
MESVLNPEAPEFQVHLNTLTTEGYVAVNKTVQTSRRYPSAASYRFYKTVTGFNVVTDTFLKNVSSQSNQILSADSQKVKLQCHDEEYNTGKVVEANDNMLDRLDLDIEQSTGKTQSDGFGQKNVSAWNNKPIISVVQIGSTTLMGAKNIPRPQLNFKDIIDNSDTLWVPKLADKPNNIVPFVLKILYNERGEAVGYDHPYKVELKLYNPPAEFIEPDREMLPFPPPLEDTNYMYIETEAAMDELVHHLDSVNEIAVDLEHHSYRSYQGFTCLIQISTCGGDFIIDALAVREHIHKLNHSFTDPRKLKIFHGAEMDMLWLQRDFGVYVVGMFDTHQAARALRLPRGSLKHLLLTYCNVDADKKYQLADWRIRPLPEELIKYARMDTHYLIYIWRQMKAQLLESGSDDPHLLLSVFEESRAISGVTYKKNELTDTSHLELYVRSQKNFNSRQMAALRLMYKWRDAQARSLDESTGYLLPNHMLITLAETLPREMQNVSTCCQPMPPFVRQNLNTIHKMILSCREMPLEPQLYEMPSSISTMLNVGPMPVENLHDLSQLPETSEENINLDQAYLIMANVVHFQPDIQLFDAAYDTYNENTDYNNTCGNNAETKYFIPPYDRYRKYRSLAQMEEIKEYKEKEAKIAAIGKGDELIKAEVLVKMQETKTMIQKEQSETKSQKETKKRPIDKVKAKVEKKAVVNKPQTTSKPQIKKPDDKIENASKHNKKNVKQFNYKKVDYKRFLTETEKPKKKKNK